jgi:cell division protein FtsL
MDYVRNLTQAYSQTPWRKQLQGIGFVFVVIVLVILTASIFMSITARSAVVGREIQISHKAISALQYEIEDMETELARLSSVAVMKQRALEMGFRPATPEEITYLNVPGIVKINEGRLAASTNPTQLDSDPVLSPAFTQTWTDWLIQNFKKPVVPLTDVQP